MTQRMKRGLSLLLASATVFSLAACAKSGEMSEKELEKKRAAKLTKLSNVYTMEYLKSDSEEKDSSIDRVKIVDGTAYFSAYYWKEIKDSNDEVSYENGLDILKLNEQEGKMERIRRFTATNNYDEVNSVSDNESVNAFYPMADGSIWYNLAISHSDWSDEENYFYENKMELVHEDANGNELARFSLYDAFSDEEDDYVYVEDILMDKSGNLALQTYNSFYVVDTNGKLLKKIPLADNDANQYVNTVTATPSGDILALVVQYGEDDSSRMIKKLDLESGKFEDLFDCKDYSNLYSFFAGENDCIYYPDTSGIRELNLSTGESKEILNFINSDINGNRTNISGYIGDRRFICNEYDRQYEGQRSAILSPVSENDTVEKYVLDFAAVYLDDNLQSAIIDFNKQSKDYRIQFIDYSQYNTDDDYDAGVTKLNNDIISGKIPDMFSLSGLPLDNYVSKNLIADLKKYMDSDEDFHAEDYLENILNITEKDGKIYSLVASYYISCLISSKDYFGGKTAITMKDFVNARKQNPDSYVFAPHYTRSEMLTGYGGGNAFIGEFLRANDGMGAFDSDDFASWLEIVKEFPEEVDWDEYQNIMNDGNGDGERNMYLSGKIMFATQTIGNAYGLRYMKRLYGNDYTLCGYPVPEGSDRSGIAVNPSVEIAVSAKSPMQKEAWSFVKYLLSEDFQSESHYGLPIRKDSLDAMLAEAIKTNDDYGFERAISSTVGVAEDETADDTAETEDAVEADIEADAETKKVATDDIAIDDVVIGGNGFMSEDEALKVTQADVDKIRAIIKSADSVVRSNEEVNKIIEEEAGAFFSGKKSAKDVCSIIQSRVTVYVTEDQ